MRLTTTALGLPYLLHLLSAPSPAAAAAAIPRHQFDSFFPGWDSMIQEILRANCSAQYADYTSGAPGPGGQVYMGFPVIECVLQQFPEFRKSEMAASAVILGLLPTTLQSLGSTSAETSLLALRRPELALMCAIGSPAVRRMTGGGFVKTVSRVMHKNARRGGDEAGSSVFVLPGLSSTRIPPTYWLYVGAAEYLVVGGAVANVLLLTYQLSAHAIVIFSPRTIILLPLWTALAVAIHLAGVFALYLRVRLREMADGGDGERRKGGWGFWIPDEVVPSVFQAPKIWELRAEDIWFQVTAWLLSIGSVAHTVFGTLIMSSLLFFSVADSVTIVGRYAASTVACRTVLRFELTGMSEATTHREHQERREVELTAGTKR